MIEMCGKARSSRTRGLRRGRGVPVRGGRGAGPAQPPPLEEVVVNAGPSRRGRGRGHVVQEVLVVAGSSGSGVQVEVVPAAGPSSRGRGHGRRGNPRHKRPGPQTIDELKIHNILESPVDHDYETPLHPKMMRVWPPSNWDPAARAPPSPPPPAYILPPQAAFMDDPPSPAPTSPASCMEPSPAEFVDCDQFQESASSPAAFHPPPPSHPRQILQVEKGAEILNYGSDSGSDESGDEDLVGTYLPIPRVFWTSMETPLDLDDEDATIADPAPIADAAPSDVPLTATDQPWRWTEFVWRHFPNSPIPPESRRETFSESNIGPTTPHDDPYDIFVDIWDRQIMEHIASETNRYAQQVATQMLQSHSLQPNSRIGRWKETTADELYVYFGLLLAMGIVVKSRLEEYWGATPDIFYTPGFSAHMSHNRFQLLSKCLHFRNNEDMCALELDSSEARLFKIQPILSHLNFKFQVLYTPAQNIALDESLLMWKGWLENSLLIPNKAANGGVRTYEVCESQTGYLWRFEIHAHKRNRAPQQYEDPLEASASSMVLRLVQGLEHKGYTLWMDSFYNSPCLARRLKSLGFDCAGILRTDRQFVPPGLHSLTKRNMAKGQVAGLTSGDVDVMVWRDYNRVATISTYHGIGQSTHRGSTKPTVISDYNIIMGGVDKKDQMLAMFPVERKRARVWYKKLFRRLLNVSVLNSFIIHHHTSTLSQRNFRIELINSLLSKHSAPLPLPCPAIFPVTTQPCRVDVTHRLDMAPFGKHQRKRRMCVKCKKRTQWVCVGCGKSVCVDPCFVLLHS